METALMLAIGFVLLVAGGESLVRGAVVIAERLGISPLLIGLTLVGFGTSTPELVTSLQAAFSGSTGIAIGNVVGSNTANILLILGITALLRPIAVSRNTFQRDGLVLAAASLACMAIVLAGALSRPAGALCLLGLVAYIVFAYVQERKPAAATLEASASAATIPAAPRSILLNVAFVIGGLALTIFGARFLVRGAIDLASGLGVSETLIGLTIVAVGTSLPELITSIVAAFRNQADIAFGNIVGSNIYNVLGILGVTALIRPIPVPPPIAAFDIWVMLGATLVLFVAAMTAWRISRWEGGLMLAFYVAYTGFLAIGQG